MRGIGTFLPPFATVLKRKFLLLPWMRTVFLHVGDSHESMIHTLAQHLRMPATATVAR